MTNPYWEELKSIYHNYIITTNQSELLSLITEEIFNKYQKNLPPNSGKSFLEFSDHLFEFFDKIFDAIGNTDALDPEDEIIKFYFEKPKFDSKIYSPITEIFSSLEGLGLKPEEIDFQRLILSQELVMLFASLDAYFSDVLDIICHAKPEIIKSKERKLDWETIITVGGWEELKDYLCEEYSNSIIWKSITDRIKFLNEKLGIETSYSQAELKQLEEAENIRNAIVHSGGKVSHLFIKKTRRTDLKIGDLIPISRDYLDKIERIARRLVKDIFVNVSKKFFGIEEL